MWLQEMMLGCDTELFEKVRQAVSVWSIWETGGLSVWVIPQTVCPHYGVLTVGVRSGVLRGVLLPLLVSTAQARTEFRL